MIIEWTIDHFTHSLANHLIIHVASNLLLLFLLLSLSLSDKLFDITKTGRAWGPTVKETPGKSEHNQNL